MILRAKDKERLIAIFQEAPVNMEVWAYGSRVDGSAHEGSDLDLVIRTHDLDKLPSNIFFQLKQKIQESNIPILVELFDWARLPESFKKNIEARYEILYSNIPMMSNDSTADYNTTEKDN
ncbi:MAG: nucleotidyltransferase domain-containing protein [Bacteroidetes bacterium]|nr:nucleotidyltransferase domain-containing protein [Bacteroidota bacterium]